MHKLNGKIIPGTQPPVRFKLNHNSNRLLPGEKNHSIWVGDLTPEVDDLSLYRFFSARFQSIVSAKGKCHFACHVLNSVVTKNIRMGGILRLWLKFVCSSSYFSVSYSKVSIWFWPYLSLVINIDRFLMPFFK